MLVDTNRYIIYELESYQNRYTVLDTLGNIISRKYITINDTCSHFISDNNGFFRIHTDTLIAIGTLINANNKHSIYFYTLNNNLDTLFSKTFLDGSGVLIVTDTYLNKENHEIIITGTVSYNNSSVISMNDAFTLKINTNGDFLQYKKYNSSYKAHINHITKTYDNGYILSGGRKYSANNNI